jgi:hypothetical protein
MESLPYEQISQALRECQDMIELAAAGGQFDEVQFAEILKKIVSHCEACSQ